MQAKQMKEIAATLDGAANDLARARQRNEVLAAQINVVEVFAAALLGPRTPQGQGEDYVWRLKDTAIWLREQADRIESSDA